MKSEDKFKSNSYIISKKKTEKEKVHNSDTQPIKILYSSVFECAIQDLFSCVYKSVSHIQINAAVFIPESRVPDVYIQNSRYTYEHLITLQFSITFF